MMSDTSAHSIPSLAVAEHLLDRLLNVYGAPEVPSIDHFMDEYTQQLKHFDPEELRDGCKILLGSFKYRRWPRPAECIDACMVARKRIATRAAVAANPNSGSRPEGFWILDAQADRIQFDAWMSDLEAGGRTAERDRSIHAGQIAVTNNWPGSDAKFISSGPFEYSHPKSINGLVEVTDGSGRRIR